ncbi:hypothetical protein [Flavihumibacter sp. ZG627]|uniref:hypothetical protein n=1 Tax=Flavihumibacter sp. ZG627 TaxID=1463156 RepID=UPI00057E57B1|nr:hypothetical protein [Flavihumibacter sp. ZG627]KIC89625.1 hypothetical protein HY58_16055 [Flavihumibacter sp. ZG627]
MKALVNQAGSVQAFVEQHIILDPVAHSTVGIILGDCVFDSHGTYKGKCFNGAVYGLKGEKLAEIGTTMASDAASLQQVRNSGWELVTSIHDHKCSWIEPTTKWSRQSLISYLNN